MVQVSSATLDDGGLPVAWQHRVRPLLRKMLAIFLPLFLVVLAAIAVVCWLEIRSRRQTIMEDQKASVILGKRVILDTLAPVLADLRYLAKTVEDSRLLEDSGAARAHAVDALTTQFVDFSAAHGYYDQIRVVAADGMEVVRVNDNGGSPAGVPANALQQKSHRYYFQDAIRIGPDKIYVSPMDLNIEHGVIETPLKPMIRVATPIVDARAHALGIVIINYTARTLLNKFSATARSKDSRLMLLNMDGYWLKGARTEDEWGFMYPDRRQLTFGNRFPQAWKRIRSTEFGQVTTGKGIFTFATVFPLLDCPEWLLCLPSEDRLNAHHYSWIIVSRHSTGNLLQAEGPLLFRALLASSAAFCILIFFSYRLAAANFQRRQAEAALRRSKENLEQTIIARTGELQATNQALRKQIDERLNAEKALRESEERYRAMMDAMDDLAYICSPDLKIEYMNPAMARKFGEDAVGKYCYEVLHRRDVPCTPCYQEAVKGGESPKSHYMLPIDDRHYHVSHNAIRHEDGTISKMTIFRDVSDLKAMEQARLESERQYRILVETMREGICVIDTRGRFTFVNRQFCGMLGYAAEEIVGRAPVDFLDGDNLAKLMRIRRQRSAGAVVPFELHWQRKSGEAMITTVSPAILQGEAGEPAGSFAVVTDITGQKRAEAEMRDLEAQLRQAQKMEAIGVLAGGIAHDFNNILMPIMGYAELIEATLQADHPAGGYIRPILEASHRAKELVSQILSFSRQSNDELQPTAIHSLVAEPLKLLKASIPANIAIEQRLDVRNRMVMANPVHIHQVVMNLCTNAYHAMEKTGGRLSVALFKADPPDGVGGTHPGARREYACLRISDTGPGIEPELLSRIFDPYFTTKAPGKGTGLGLSVVHGIVTALDGDIRVESRTGQGATFSVYLPLISTTDTGDALDTRAALPGGSETVLLVDDEAPIVQLEERILGRLGYTVVTSSGSLDALGIFTADPGRFDLVITDLTMPDMTGLDLAQKISGIRPGIPIIMLTGFSEQLGQDDMQRSGIRRIIMKPVLIKNLAEAIRGVLGEA